MGKVCWRKFFEEVERSTGEEETKMTKTVSPNQENYFKISELFTTQILEKETSKAFRSRKLLETMLKLE